ncbi:MAG: ABC transporter substrate-binding protein [Candidatus Thiodiazotropha sp. (ex Lucinoma aequizonata)]|nr:ABC transporter substrate-binding protein [Candidatus Thiodiazotropha sp. (ex Lucinoma aequizonata)]MCU7897056.1 ABC transporter substrate-binding protein [Candidatus Thiodiazotropha sp. (ex Lucinoma aequizonata)]MCU7910120.1 ABC transporter substrate-binding protein [Candidatus Thiodiazotropha sp. (ex Lucinoma aequizonata)]MCU7911800.1 ABC transporter substrate-binding protein [Candidatus Thiodiazotropha sp. (ex Lucinoma aequizonata)]
MMTSTAMQAKPGYNYPQPQLRAPLHQEVDTGTVLREGMTNLLGFLRQSEEPNPQMITAFLEQKIAPYFDFDYMATWAAGPMNRRMNDQQRTELAQKIKVMLFSTLTERLAKYNNQEVRFFRPRRVGENEVKVRVGILQPDGYPSNIDFRFYRSKAGWKIFDVSANGNSAIVFYRQHFVNKMRTQMRTQTSQEEISSLTVTCLNSSSGQTLDFLV